LCATDIAKILSCAGAGLLLRIRKGTFLIMSERISIKPNVCNGRPVVRGTRITVQTILEFVAAGDSVEDVLEEYPKLTRADVQACLNYASRLMGNHFSVVRAA
jgi:uncharacterized protein (DUF433 family)